MPAKPQLEWRRQAKGMREMVVRSNYIVLYRETAQQVEVVNVFHARQQWPKVKG
jgi:plasmid stabilization system protein ParE